METQNHGNIGTIGLSRLICIYSLAPVFHTSRKPFVVVPLVWEGQCGKVVANYFLQKSVSFG